MKNLDFKKNFLNFCGAILIGLFITLIFSLIAQFKSINQLFSNQMVGSILQFSVLALIILVLFKIYNEEIGKTPFKKISTKDFFYFNNKDLKMVLLLLVISIVLGSILPSIISNITQDKESNFTFTVIYAIGAITYTPFLEELIFRGMFYNIAYEWLDMEDTNIRKIAFVVNIVVFLSVHYVSYDFTSFNFIISLLIAILPRIVISVSLSYVYIKTKDIKYNILLHMLYNLVVVIRHYI